MKLNGKHICLVLGTVALIVVIYKPFANLAGYCAAESRFIPVEELVLKMQRRVFESYPPERYSAGDDHIINAIPYTSFDAFRTANKDCCRVVDASDIKFIPPLMVTKLRGYAAKSLRIKYRVEASPPSGKSGFIESYYTFTNCGEFFFD